MASGQGPSENPILLLSSGAAFELASASSALRSASLWAAWIFLISSAHSIVFVSSEKSY